MGKTRIMIDQIREQKRRRQANKISVELTASGRNAPPADSNFEEWVPVVDIDSNKTIWFPKDLYNEYQRLRFSDAGEP